MYVYVSIIEFISHLLTCQFNSTLANYKTGAAAADDNNNNNNNNNNNKCDAITVNQTDKPLHDRVPKSVETSPEGKVATLWKQQVQTSRTIRNNKPDNTFRDNE